MEQALYDSPSKPGSLCRMQHQTVWESTLKNSRNASVPLVVAVSVTALIIGSGTLWSMGSGKTVQVS